MKMIRNLFVAAAALLALSAVPASANSMWLCAPSAQSGSKRIVNPNTTTAYTINSRGCGLIAAADAGWFQSQGFVFSPGTGSIIYVTGVQTGTTDLVIGTLPPNAYIQQVIYSNAVAAAVTGGISIGTTANGTDVVAAQAVGSSALTFTPNASILKQVFSTTAGTPLHAAAVTAWNSTNVTITVVYGYF